MSLANHLANTRKKLLAKVGAIYLFSQDAKLMGRRFFTMRAKEHKDWPSVWTCIGGAAPSAGEVSQHGTLTGVGLSSNAGIRLQADYKGRKCDASFLPKDRVGQLGGLRNKLTGYIGWPMRDVENVEL
jgi:hypothetical protein